VVPRNYLRRGRVLGVTCDVECEVKRAKR
jgi:hypothetical protein